MEEMLSTSRLKRKLHFVTQLLTPRKILNRAIMQAQFLLRHTKLHYFPTKLTIDIGNVCNLKCPLCPTGRGDKGAAKGFMHLKEYRPIIDQLGPYLTKLELHNWGEPLLNKDLIEMIEYAKQRNIPVIISSNLNTLDGETAERLIRTNIDKILISCDGASEETYVQYRVGGNFQKVISNIRLLADAKKRLKNHATSIRMLFHVFSHNEHEISSIKQLAGELGVDLLIDTMRTDMGKEIFEKVEDSIERDGAWIPVGSEHSFYDLKKRSKKRQVQCKQLWENAVINWDGSVLPCCHVYGERFAFGNIFKEPFKTIWNNQKYSKARQEVSDKIAASPTICHTCKENGFVVF